MVRLRDIPRTATFAWSPGAASPLVATGTRAGAVDVNFSNETCLELWDLGLGRQDGEELQPVGKISTDSGFNDLAWTESEDNSRGVIAGALENGSLDLWDADKLLNGASDPVISRTTKHSGAIKALQFNPKHPNLLATGGANGELYISDLNNMESSFRLGSAAARADDIECLDWNKKVAHILVTGSSSGFVTVWDVKTKRETLTLNNVGRKAVSSVAWDPEKPTRLVTATLDDPLIHVWDLRNSHAPERSLRGHEAGVLSLSWCNQDRDLLLSSGKDNRTLCWNPQTSEAYGEFPVVTNWTFQTRWNPHNPNFFATASFDGKISVQTIQNTRTETTEATADQNQALDGEDFFARAQTQPQVSNFSLPKAPKWLERPCGASFGFGGRVVSIGLAEKDKRGSKIKITPFEVDESVGKATETFETALKEGDLRSICETRATDAVSDEDKSDWKVIEALISGNPKKGIIEYLGFQDQSADEAADSLAKLGLDKEEETNGEEKKEPEKESEKEPEQEKQSRGPGAKKHKRLQSMFNDTTPEADAFLSDIAASKEAKINNPFQIFNGSESDAEKGITRALLLGDFERAVDVALKEDRLSDAFMIAICGGPKCVEKAQEHYFSKQTDGPNYIRLLASIVGKNLWDVVHNADLSNWKEVMAALCTFADEKEFADLCEALGDRLEDQIRASDDKAARKDASLCFLVGSKLEKVVGIWTEELRENEQKGLETATDSSSFSVHVRALQGLIEKVTIFRQVTNFQDTERAKEADWKLGNLYDKYIEYADVVATHGRLQIAQQYLDLVPVKHPEAEIARSRIQLAMRQAAPKRGQVATAPATRAPAVRPLPPQPAAFQPPTSFTPGAAPQNPYAPQTTAATPYAPAAAPPANPYAQPAPAVNPYAPTAAVTPQPSTNPYAPAGAGSYAPTGYQPTAPSAFGAPPGASVPPPPRVSSSQSPANVSTYTTATNLPAWNDLPDDFMKSSRRTTPAAGGRAVGSPFPNQSPTLTQGPPPVGPPTAQRPPSVPPPPKGPAPPPRMMSPPSAVPPPSMVPGPAPPANPYASLPQSPQLANPMGAPGPIPRGASPYNPPPSMPPPTNRYAPSPAAQSPQLQSRVPVPPPAQAVPSPYAPQQPPVASSPYAPTPSAAVPPPPMQQTPQGPGSRSSTASSQKRATPAPPKYPSGDRSHIPADAMPVYEILSADMQRVRGRAPSSFKAQVDDAERRLNILFDHLNNEDLLKPNTIADMTQLAQAIQARDYETARTIHVEIMANRTEECGNWMVGVKRLISMSRATP